MSEEPTKRRPPASVEASAKALAEELSVVSPEEMKGVHEITISAEVGRAQFSAMLLYIQYPGLSVRQIWENYRIDPDDHESSLIRDVIAYSTLAAHARKQDWEAKRVKHWREVEAKVLRHLQSTHIQQELSEIGRLDRLEGRLEQVIFGDEENGISPVMPKTLEGAIKVLLDLHKLRSQKRELVTSETAEKAIEMRGGEPIPEAPTKKVPEIEDQLDPEELAQLAHQLAAGRARGGSGEEVGDGPEGAAEDRTAGEE